MPLLESARAAFVSATSDRSPHHMLAEDLTILQRARSAILTTKFPDVVKPATAEYLRAVTHALRALSFLREQQSPLTGANLTAYTTAIRDTTTSFARAQKLRTQLECQADLPQCARSRN
jgi:hypothetical protein